MSMWGGGDRLQFKIKWARKRQERVTFEQKLEGDKEVGHIVSGESVQEG